MDFKLNQQFEIPDLDINVLFAIPDRLKPIRRNPKFQVSEAYTTVESVKYKLFDPSNPESFNGFLDSVSMTSFLYPRADEERLKILNLLMAILFHIDNVYGDNPNLTEEDKKLLLLKWFSALKNPKEYQDVGDLLTNSLLFVANKIYTSGTVTKNYYVKLLETFIEYLPQNIDLQGILKMTEQEYIDYRIKNSGMRPTILLQQYANNNFLTESITSNPELSSIFADMERCVEEIGCLANDIYSWPKEFLNEKLEGNLIQVIMRKRRVGLKVAYMIAVDIVNKLIEKFEILHAKLSSYLNKANLSQEDQLKVANYIEGLDDIVSATFNWQNFTKRYRHKRHPLLQLRDN